MQDGIPFSLLIVDDDSEDLMLIDEAFMKIGYATEVKKFLNGKALFHYLDSIKPALYPNLIVLDNTLPELGALDVLAKLQQTPSYQAIPVVIYSTFISPEKRMQLKDSGAYACIEKGYTEAEIVAVAKRLRSLAGGAGHSD